MDTFLGLMYMYIYIYIVSLSNFLNSIVIQAHGQTIIEFCAFRPESNIVNDNVYISAGPDVSKGLGEVKIPLVLYAINFLAIQSYT